MTSPKNKWRKETIDFVVQNYRTMSLEDLAIRLKIPKREIEKKIKELRLWKKEEHVALLDNFDKMSVKQLAEILDKNVNDVKQKLEKIGVPVASVDDIPRLYCKMICNREEVGRGASGQKIYKCKYYGITVGEDSLPSPKCYREKFSTWKEKQLEILEGGVKT